MTDKRALEWISSTEEERKQLYTVVMAIRMAHDLSWDEVFERAHGHPVVISEHVEKNFLRGIIGHKKIAPIHRWVIENYLPVATVIAPEIFDPSLLTRWSDFIGSRHLYGQLRTKLGGVMGLTGRAIDQPIDDRRIKLGQKYYFELDGSLKGSLMTLEGYEGKWYPMSPHVDEASLIVNAGVKLHRYPA